MNDSHNIYLISDSTGETLDRIFLALKAQFTKFEYQVHQYSFTRTENQISKILQKTKINNNAIILYTIVDTNLANFLSSEAKKINIPCFGVLGDLILNFSKILNQKASHIPSGQHILNEEYYERIEAIQFTMNHDDGNMINEIDKSDIILMGVSRTSKTPTSIYLANKGLKTTNIPLVNEKSVPIFLKKNPKKLCVIGLTSEAQRLYDIRKNRMNLIKESEKTDYIDLDKIKKEVEDAKRTFKKYNWPVIDVTRKSVEETAAAVIKIYEITKKNG
tara:strand:- start:159 stop:983 length:825 start_codon:yes stop_codon:yes gene_type:complete